MSVENISKLMEKAELKEKKIKNFSDILENLSTTEDKKKYLWKEIYENAINDRESAKILFTDLLLASKGNITIHTANGTIMSKYLERMCKSNDQILRLAELIAKEEEKSISMDDIYKKIGE